MSASGAAPPARAVVIGVGNPFRGDDAVGHRVLDLLALEVAETAGPIAPGSRPDAALVPSDGEPSRMIDAWAGADLAIVIDAVVSGSPVGTLHVVDGAEGALPTRSAASSHAAGVAEAWALAEALDALPTRLVVLGVEAGTLEPGAELSPEVDAALPALLQEVRALIATTHHRPEAAP